MSKSLRANVVSEAISTTVRIYNTLTGRKEDLMPVCPGEVRMYVCGVTAYDECHLGHARAYVSFDVIKRYLEFCGHKVRYVRNVTDVDDKIIEKAKKEGRGFQDVTAQYYGEFSLQMLALGLSLPEWEPRATQHIGDMVELIGRLIAGGFAYAAGGDVFFEVAQFSPYGRLSKRPLEEMIAGARVEVNEKKKSPLDFVLWKAAKAGEPFWESPWGRGRPGWHIECSAMSMKYLGDTFDLHGGGQDLIFPHHENEIAQSGAATGRPLANCWVHNGFVLSKSQKMSKSLGNVFSLKRLFELVSAPVVKFFLLTKHYRSPVDFALEEMQEYRKNLERIDNTIGVVQRRLEECGGGSAGAAPCVPRQRKDCEGIPVIAEFCEAMDDDFNTPRAVALIHNLLGKMHTNLATQGPTAELAPMLDALLLILDVLGVPYQPLVMAQVRSGRALPEDQERVLLAKESLCEAEIVSLIAARNQARHEKNFARSDSLRKALAEKGIVLRDEKGETTTWARVSEKAPKAH